MRTKEKLNRSQPEAERIGSLLLTLIGQKLTTAQVKQISLLRPEESKTDRNLVLTDEAKGLAGEIFTLISGNSSVSPALLNKGLMAAREELRAHFGDNETRRTAASRMLQDIRKRNLNALAEEPAKKSKPRPKRGAGLARVGLAALALNLVLGAVEIETPRGSLDYLPPSGGEAPSSTASFPESGSLNQGRRRTAPIGFEQELSGLGFIGVGVEVRPDERSARHQLRVKEKRPGNKARKEQSVSKVREKQPTPPPWFIKGGLDLSVPDEIKASITVRSNGEEKTYPLSFLPRLLTTESDFDPTDIGPYEVLYYATPVPGKPGYFNINATYHSGSFNRAPLPGEWFRRVFEGNLISPLNAAQVEKIIEQVNTGEMKIFLRMLRDGKPVLIKIEGVKRITPEESKRLDEKGGDLSFAFQDEDYDPEKTMFIRTCGAAVKNEPEYLDPLYPLIEAGINLDEFRRVYPKDWIAKLEELYPEAAAKFQARMRLNLSQRFLVIKGEIIEASSPKAHSPQKQNVEIANKYRGDDILKSTTFKLRQEREHRNADRAQRLTQRRVAQRY